MTTWKDHVAKNMRGKKFGSRTEANAFMKKLSADWKKSKTGGTIDEFNVAANEIKGKGSRRRPMKAPDSEEEYMGAGIKDIAKKMMNPGKELVKIATKERDRLRKKFHIMGGSTALLLSKGLGDGAHLSVLPK